MLQRLLVVTRTRSARERTHEAASRTLRTTLLLQCVVARGIDGRPTRLTPDRWGSGVRRVRRVSGDDGSGAPARRVARTQQQYQQDPQRGNLRRKGGL